MSTTMEANLRTINQGRQLEIQEKDPNWRYRYLQEKPVVLQQSSMSLGEIQPMAKPFWEGQVTVQTADNGQVASEYKENLLSSSHRSFAQNFITENGAASAMQDNTSSTKNSSTVYSTEDLETIRRLDTYLNLSLDRTWDTKWSIQPQFPGVTVPVGTGANNYQYNPKSTVTRVRGCLAWDGYLPPRAEGTPIEYSKKVFLGGVPWDISEQHLELIFSRYGDFKVEWPNNFNTKRNTTKSFLYLIFESLTSISRLLADCSKEQHGGSVTYNYNFARDKISSKPFQVIPWIVTDNVAAYKQQLRLNNKLTVFVGALHGRLYAQALGRIFEELFHDVAYVQIDTDRYKYPIGSGRVTFNSVESYRKAVEENFLTIIAPKFSKRIQIEPYIEDEPCGKCKVISAPNFCKSRLCFDYFCDNCWGWHHSLEGLKNHLPVKRNRKIERY
ncbi:hypothetical protein ACHWQZ_G017504 [Mnemiopsis leidyi]